MPDLDTLHYALILIAGIGWYLYATKKQRGG
jgi:hypothetical protein